VIYVMRVNWGLQAFWLSIFFFENSFKNCTGIQVYHDPGLLFTIVFESLLLFVFMIGGQI